MNWKSLILTAMLLSVPLSTGLTEESGKTTTETSEDAYPVEPGCTTLITELVKQVQGMPQVETYVLTDHIEKRDYMRHIAKNLVVAPPFFDKLVLYVILLVNEKKDLVLMFNISDDCKWLVTNVPLRLHKAILRRMKLDKGLEVKNNG